jgi:hypothetical protein
MMMKFLLLLVSLATLTSGFSPIPSQSRWISSRAADKINEMVDLESPKVRLKSELLVQDAALIHFSVLRL